jgi:parvulin-like peptidyl-prolyl isomerase
MCAVASAQVASHAPTGVKPKASAHGQSAAPATTSIQVTGKPVAKVNGAVLTDRDLLREMYLMFPYAQQHNGFPKEMEPQIRQGALQMIIFEELLYQEGNRRKIVISDAQIGRAMAQFRKTFPNEAAYQEFLKQEVKGSQAVLRSEIRRSFIIEEMLRREITNKAVVTPGAARAYYDQNPLKFQRPETIHFQSISIIPPNDTADVQKEVRRRAEEALKQAKNAKNYREFGLLAEKLSDDDYRVKMGDRQPVESAKLPPEVVKVASGMQPGQVSDLIKLGPAYTIIRLEAHKPAGKVPFDEIKGQLQSDLQKEKTEQLRSALGKKLRANAKIELM